MKIKKKTSVKTAKKILRKARARKKISGTAEKPRLNIFKGGRSIVAQVIDDSSGKTLVGVSSVSKENKESLKGANKETAGKLGKIVAGKCREKGIKAVVFDRGGKKYHGIIKAFADAARENGIKF